MNRFSKRPLALSLLVIVAATFGALGFPATTLADHENYGFWNHDGCYVGQFGEAGYGYWEVISCDSPDLGYVDTDDCYYHWDGSRYAQQICWVYAQNGDYLSYVHYDDGAMFTFSRIGGVTNQSHFHVEPDGTLWIEVVPELDPDGWMLYEEYEMVLIINELEALLDQMEQEQADQATASANNQIILSQQWNTLYSEAYNTIYSCLSCG